MEVEVLLTGIGGQGIQLAARTLANAAIFDGLETMMFGTYGGEMRGGATAATVVIGATAVHTPPDVDEAWLALAMHDRHWPQVRERMRPGGWVVIDRSVFQSDPAAPGCEVLEFEATDVAMDLGSPRAASMVALGALAAATGIVSLQALHEAAKTVLPSYRTQHVESNIRALSAGWNLAGMRASPGWASGCSAKAAATGAIT